MPGCIFGVTEKSFHPTMTGANVGRVGLSTWSAAEPASLVNQCHLKAPPTAKDTNPKRQRGSTVRQRGSTVRMAHGYREAPARISFPNGGHRSRNPR